jgi:hypothetical protein
MNQELGSVDKVKKIVKLTGYLNTYPGFSEHPKVMDAVSEQLVEIFRRGRTSCAHGGRRRRDCRSARRWRWI